MDFFINSQINLGSMVLSTSLLYFIIGIASGSVLLIIFTKKKPDSRKITSDLITNFLLVVILTWKLFPVLLAPGDIISSPVSILYSSGGTPGILLGVGFGIVYMGIKLFLFWKHSVGANGRSPLRDVLKPIIVFFVSVGFVSISLFFVSWIVRNNMENSDIINGNEDAMNSTPTRGDVAPGFKLINTDGDLISLEDYKGKWVILNFWATWCPPCRGELPTLIRFYKQADKDKIVLLGINAYGTEKIPKGGDVRSYVSTFVGEKGVNYPVLLDKCDGGSPCVSTLYGAKNLPTTVIISPDGIIAKIKTGTVDTYWLRASTSGN